MGSRCGLRCKHAWSTVLALSGSGRPLRGSSTCVRASECIRRLRPGAVTFLRPTSPHTRTSVTTTAFGGPLPAASWTSQRELRTAKTADLFRRAAESSDPREVEALQEEVVVLNLPMAEALASRYRRRGVDADDIDAVARLALVKAVQRFEYDAGHDFASFAAPTIRGEIKRYFRDNGWMVRPPRRIQEIQGAIAGVQSQLQTQLGRSPRPSHLAEALDLEVSDVEEALAARGCFAPASLDLPVADGSDKSLGDLLTDEQSDFSAAEARAALGPLVRQLSSRDRHIIDLRFFQGLTQREIAADIGVTQMQVSRLLARILADLRQGVGSDL